MIDKEQRQETEGIIAESIRVLYNSFFNSIAETIFAARIENHKLLRLKFLFFLNYQLISPNFIYKQI